MNTGYTVISILCFLVTAFFIFNAVMAGRSSNADGVAIDEKERYRKHMKGFIWASIVLGIFTVIFGAMAHTTAFAATDDTSSGSIETTSQITTEVTTAAADEETPPDEEEQLEPGVFVVNLTEKDLRVWMNANGFSYDEFKGDFSWKSMPSKAKEKDAAILAAIRKYINPDARFGFSDGVIFPLEYALEHIYIRDGWSKLDEETQIAEINEAMRAVKCEIFTNPTYCDMWLQMFADDEEINERNPWIASTLAEWDSYFEKTEEPIGISNFLYTTEENNPDSPLFLKDDYLLTAARVCEMLDFFEYIPENPIQERLSVKNWHLSVTDANMARTKLCPEQEKRPAIMLARRFKSGNMARLWGTNTLDGRGMKFAIPTPRKETPPPAETTTTTSRMTTTTPPPTTTTTRKTTVTTEDTELYTEKEQECTVIIKYRYLDDNGIVRKRSDNSKYDKKFTVPVGKSFSENSPDPKYINRSGYRLKYDYDKTVSGIAEGTLWEYTVWYEKINDVILIIDNPTTTAPPPPVTTPPTTATTLPDGQGGKDPSVGTPAGSNNDGQGEFQGQTEPPRSDYTTVITTPPITTSRYETDGSGNVTATTGPVIGGTAPVTTPISTVTGDKFIDTTVGNGTSAVVNNGTDTGVYNTEVPKPD